MRTLFSAGPGIAPKSCSFVRNRVHAFELLDLCSKEVIMVSGHTRGRKKI